MFRTTKIKHPINFNMKISQSTVVPVGELVTYESAGESNDSNRGVARLCGIEEIV